MTSIGNYAFEGCNSITKVTFPSTLQTLGQYAFQYCSGLTTLVNNSNNIRTIPDYCFYYCSSLANLEGLDRIITIGKDAFGYTSLASLKFFPSVETINQDAFEATLLTSAVLSSSVKRIDRAAFYRCEKLTTFDFSACSELSSISRSCFNECTGLTSIVCNETITGIGFRAFFRCLSLEEITIPDSVTLIYPEAFSGCINLKVIHGCKNVVSLGVQHDGYLGNVFGSCKSLETIEGLEKITDIRKNMFASCTNLKNLSLNWSNLKSIESAAFINCTSLTGTITLPEITKCTVASDAFSGCSPDLIITRTPTSGN